MFTGLIQDIGTVQSAEQKGDRRFVIETRLNLGVIPEGASISCAGCCLTVVQKGSNWFAVDVSRETLASSGLALWTTGTKINLEPSLRLGDEMGGHIVSGHVDGQAVIKEITPEGDSHRLLIQPPDKLLKFIAAKGSVTLDGVSLTVNTVGKDGFTVNIIPHTWEKTTFGLARAGDSLNIEIDMLARYVARLLEKDQ